MHASPPTLRTSTHTGHAGHALVYVYTVSGASRIRWNGRRHENLTRRQQARAEKGKEGTSLNRVTRVGESQ